MLMNNRIKLHKTKLNFKYTELLINKEKIMLSTMSACKSMIRYKRMKERHVYLEWLRSFSKMPDY